MRYSQKPYIIRFLAFCTSAKWPYHTRENTTDDYKLTTTILDF